MEDGGVVFAGKVNRPSVGIPSGYPDFVAIKLDSEGHVEWRWKVRCYINTVYHMIFSSEPLLYLNREGTSPFNIPT